MDENEISRHVVDAALKIHRALGPGLYELVYEAILAHELIQRGLTVARQVPLPLSYNGLRFEEAFRIDLLIDGKVVVEIKSVENLLSIHRKQTLTYIKLADFRLGLLINFGADYIRDGVVRIANQLPEERIAV